MSVSYRISVGYGMLISQEEADKIAETYPPGVDCHSIGNCYGNSDTVLAVDASYRSVSLQYGGSFMAISPEEMASKELAFREIIEDACVIAGIECRALGWFVAGVIC